jgi:precorrin-2 dehydrogenase/sirohydrochlorin ferrochelatase
VAFDYPVALDLAGRRCVVLGGGPVAAERIAGLLASDAHVAVVSEAPSEEILDHGDARRVELTVRTPSPDDLDGAFLAVHTREEGTPDDVAALWDRAEERGVLFAALDDVEHCHFGAMSTIRRGDLRITVSTAGRAPALSKRIRRDLERVYDEAYGRLVEALHEAREQALPRDVPFPEWAARWEAALDDLEGLLAEVRAGRHDGVVATVRRTVRPGEDV